MASCGDQHEACPPLDLELCLRSHGFSGSKSPQMQLRQLWSWLIIPGRSWWVNCTRWSTTRSGLGYPARLFDLGLFTPSRECCMWKKNPHARRLGQTTTGFPLVLLSGSGALRKRCEQLQHLQRVLGVFLCSDLTPVFKCLFLSSAAADASGRRCSPLCVENIFLWRASAKLGGSRLYRFLSRCVSVSAGVSLLRERESAPPAPERRPITAQPRGTGAKWVSAGLCGDGWASLWRWWMMKVAVFVPYHAEWVTTATSLLRRPPFDLVSEAQVSRDFSHLRDDGSLHTVQKSPRRKTFAASQVTPTSNWLWFFLLLLFVFSSPKFQ